MKTFNFLRFRCLPLVMRMMLQKWKKMNGMMIHNPQLVKIYGFEFRIIKWSIILFTGIRNRRRVFTQWLWGCRPHCRGKESQSKSNTEFWWKYQSLEKSCSCKPDEWNKRRKKNKVSFYHFVQLQKNYNPFEEMSSYCNFNFRLMEEERQRQLERMADQQKPGMFTYNVFWNFEDCMGDDLGSAWHSTREFLVLWES